MMRNTCVILLAGGSGLRMNSSIPKQFLKIKEKVIARYSFELFMSMPEVAQIAVVCAPQYQEIFHSTNSNISITFALPGERRQDSVYNGLRVSDPAFSLICIHDAARPCINVPLTQRVLAAGKKYGAAAVGMPVKSTIKECSQEKIVTHTPNRAGLWEIQTPQVVRRDLLESGFVHALEHNITVTDDVALVELLKLPVKLVEGCYKNLKITTPEDLILAEYFIKDSK